jgi:hypothetical protein
MIKAKKRGKNELVIYIGGMEYLKFRLADKNVIVTKSCPKEIEIRCPNIIAVLILDIIKETCELAEEAQREIDEFGTQIIRKTLFKE